MGRALTEVAAEEGWEINKIDIISHPLQAMNATITMIPAIVTERGKISGLWLSKEKIRNFLRMP